MKRFQEKTQLKDYSTWDTADLKENIVFLTFKLYIIYGS